jgi:nicotinamide-nucleotide adenylyltransferase
MRILSNGETDLNGEKMCRRALLMGRFQPFHKGHLYMVKRILENFDEVVIGLGSAQYSSTNSNPFTSEERKEMIERVMRKEGIEGYVIVAIEDLHDDERWVDHVKSLVPGFVAVFSHDPLTKRLFSEKGYEVEETRLFERELYSGTEVRRRMERGENWTSLVPKEVADFLREIGGEKRIREIAYKS